MIEYELQGKHLLSYRVNDIILCLCSLTREETPSIAQYSSILPYVDCDLIDKHMKLGKAYILDASLHNRRHPDKFPKVAMLVGNIA